MTRLFLSLYIFIVLSLVILSGLLNHVFYKQDKIAPEKQAVVSLLTSMHKTQTLNLQSLDPNFFNIQSFALSDMAWNQVERDALAKGESIVLYDANNNVQVYLQTTAKELIEITLIENMDTATNYLLYSGVFFVLLAILIALWLWPLWKDLQRLKTAVSNINSNGRLSAIDIEPRSVVYPIALTLNEQGQRIEQLLNTQRELTGAVAHEFRTPLSRLKFALVAQHLPSDSPLYEMNHDIDELEKLVQEMLSYTSMESQEPELNISQIPLLSLCQQRANHLLRMQHIKIACSGENATILGDEHYIERVIDNLVNNAYRYAQQEIRIQISQQDDGVQLIVEDDGEGVPIDYRERIFDPFFRPDSGRDRTRGGAGLGLAIVQRIMHWHEGKCWVEDSSLGGAAFCLEFPHANV